MNNQQLSDHIEIEQLIYRMALCQDRRDWAGLLSIFDEMITTEYPSAVGGTTETRSAADQIERWRVPLESLDASQHILSGLVLTLNGDQATATVNEQGWMRRDAAIGDSLWHFGGTLDVQLRRTSEGWRIRTLRAGNIWTQGNIGVFPAPENIV